MSAVLPFDFDRPTRAECLQSADALQDVVESWRAYRAATIAMHTAQPDTMVAACSAHCAAWVRLDAAFLALGVTP